MAPLNIFTVVAIFSLVLFTSCSSSRLSQSDDSTQKSIWQTQPIAVDGDDGEWAKPLPYLDKKQKFDYRISNDSINLYILLTTAEEQTQRKIMQGGLTVWINNTAQLTDERAVGISFPTGASSSRGRTILPVTGSSNSGNRVMALDNLKDYTLFGFSDKEVENYSYGQPNDEGIEVKLDFNSANELVYEASVPLKTIFRKSNSTRYAGKNMAVGFYIDGIPPQPGNRGDGGGGVSFGGGIGTGSFGSGGGMGLSIGTGLGRIGGKGSRFKQSKTWQVVSLAKPTKNL